ncbi:tyrosine--tRNA ligase [Candidatus Parcubacteria bacterium]|nr:MAG: tyrosine--tRNA ligase [Candidatus Parcubacteria bacterium]
MPLITDPIKVDEVLTRGVENIYPSAEALRKDLLSGRRLRLYCGFDPSAPSLHIGNAILINKLAQFQALGHEVIFLIGDFTGMIGDPTDKLSARKQLSREEVLANSRNYQKQASAYLKFNGDNAAKVLYNSAWNDKLTFKDLIELSAHFTVQQMIQRDMFQRRLSEEKPIFLHEFLYPLAQGYDSVAMNVDLEIGGNDQMFNMMCGRDLQKSINQKEKYVMTLKLLADDKGKKMGKSEGNAVFLDTPPRDMYGIIMSWPDGVIGVAFELCTRVPFSEVEEIKKQLADNQTNPRDLKMRLAFEITQIIHGPEAAREAEDYFVRVFQRKERPQEAETKTIHGSAINIVELLVDTGLASSKSEARRLIKEGGIKLEGQKVNSDQQIVKLTSQPQLLQRGKRRFIRVKKA